MFDEDPALIQAEFAEEPADLPPLTEEEIDELERENARRQGFSWGRD